MSIIYLLKVAKVTIGMSSSFQREPTQWCVLFSSFKSVIDISLKANIRGWSLFPFPPAIRLLENREGDEDESTLEFQVQVFEYIEGVSASSYIFVYGWLFVAKGPSSVPGNISFPWAQ